MQPFATRKEVVSNNNHDAFSALKGANLVLMQSMQLHESDFLAASILQVPTRPYVSVTTAQPALNYLRGALSGSSPRQRTKAPTAVHASCLTDSLQGLLSSQVQPGMSQEHGQDVHPHAGAEKHSPAPQGQCSHGILRSAPCLLIRDSSRRSKRRPRGKGDLNICGAQELHTH